LSQHAERYRATQRLADVEARIGAAGRIECIAESGVICECVQ